MLELPTAALPLQLIVAAVLAWSGIGKLSKSGSTTASLRSLGMRVPGPPALVDRGFPLIELALAVGLLFAPRAWLWLAAALSSLLFALLLVVVVRALRSGRPVHCRCFGSEQVLTRGSALRNGLLALGALILVALPLAPITTHASTQPAVLVGVLLGLGLSVAVIGLTIGRSGDASTEPSRSSGELAPGAGDPIPDLSLLDVQGHEWRMPVQASRRGALLVWTSADCPLCRELDRHLPADAQLGGRIPVWKVRTVGGASELLDGELGDFGGAVSRILQTETIPAALLLGTDGRIAAGPSYGPDAISELISDTKDAVALADRGMNVAANRRGYPVRS